MSIRVFSVSRTRVTLAVKAADQWENKETQKNRNKTTLFSNMMSTEFNKLLFLFFIFCCLHLGAASDTAIRRILTTFVVGNRFLVRGRCLERWASWFNSLLSFHKRFQHVSYCRLPLRQKIVELFTLRFSLMGTRSRLGLSGLYRCCDRLFCAGPCWRRLLY